MSERDDDSSFKPSIAIKDSLFKKKATAGLSVHSSPKISKEDVGGGNNIDKFELMSRFRRLVRVKLINNVIFLKKYQKTY